MRELLNLGTCIGERPSNEVLDNAVPNFQKYLHVATTLSSYYLLQCLPLSLLLVEEGEKTGVGFRGQTLTWSLLLQLIFRKKVFNVRVFICKMGTHIYSHFVVYGLPGWRKRV